MLAAADILVLYQPGTMIDLRRQMAAGSSVIAAVYQLSEAGKLVREAGSGIVVPSEDPTPSRHALLKMRANEDATRRYDDAGHGYLRASFDASLLNEAVATRRIPQRGAHVGVEFFIVQFSSR